MVPLGPDCKNEELIATQQKAMHDVIYEFVRQVTSPHTQVRTTAMSSLRLIARLQNKSVTEVMSPHSDILVDMVPPKKHLLRHQPVSAQIGLMDGNTFCTTIEPRLFTIDLKIVTHKVFFHEVVTLSEADEAILNKLDCYKSVTNFVPLRKSALHALAACHYIDIPHVRDRIFQILLKALEKNIPELQETAFVCMKKFISGYSVERESLLGHLRPLFSTLGDHRTMTLNNVKQLSYLTQLFPNMFTEKLSEQLLEIIKRLISYSITNNQGNNFLSVAKTGETEQKIVTVLGIYHQIPAAKSVYVIHLVELVLGVEEILMIESSCPYRAPLVKFLLRYPKETIDLMLCDNSVKNPQYNRFLIYLLEHPDKEPFKNEIQSRADRLNELILKTYKQQGYMG